MNMSAARVSAPPRWLALAICVMALAGLGGCSSGPEDHGFRLAVPRQVPATREALRSRTALGPPPCLHNRVPQTVRVTVSRETDQQGLTWPLAPNRFLPLPPNETLVLSFASVPDGRFDDDEVQIRARLYMISTPPRPAPGVGCPWELRADAEGRIDLFAAKPVRGPR